MRRRKWWRGDRPCTDRTARYTKASSVHYSTAPPCLKSIQVHALASDALPPLVILLKSVVLLLRRGTKHRLLPSAIVDRVLAFGTHCREYSSADKPSKSSTIGHCAAEIHYVPLAASPLNLPDAPELTRLNRFARRGGPPLTHLRGVGHSPTRWPA
jgi:hypothetical protein